jgi:hypothetical protein
VRRFVDGSAIVTARLGRAFFPHDQDGELRLIATGIRCGPTLWLGYTVLDTPHPSPLWLAGGACAWCISAWRASKPGAEAEQPTAEEKLEHDDAEIYAGLVDYLRRLIGNRNGVHLGEALKGLQEQRRLPDGVTAAEFGRQLQRRGIPVRASLKVAGQVGPGVHRDDLPAAEQPLPATASAAAG